MARCLLLMLINETTASSASETGGAQQNRSVKEFDGLDAAKAWAENLVTSGRYSVASLFIHSAEEPFFTQLVGVDADRHYVWSDVQRKGELHA